MAQLQVQTAHPCLQCTVHSHSSHHVAGGHLLYTRPCARHLPVYSHDFLNPKLLIPVPEAKVGHISAQVQTQTHLPPPRAVSLPHTAAFRREDRATSRRWSVIRRAVPLHSAVPCATLSLLAHVRRPRPRGEVTKHKHSELPCVQETHRVFQA